MIIVCDTEKGLFAAGEIAGNLFATRRIQGWSLSKDCAGIVLNVFPGMVDVVKEKGGMEKYRAWLLEMFTNIGYKLYDPDAPVAIPPGPVTATAIEKPRSFTLEEED
jgi:hypothetical protein